MKALYNWTLFLAGTTVYSSSAIIDSCIKCLEKLFLHVALNGTVTGWVGNARQNETIINLLIFQKVSFGLIDSSGNDLSGARTARSSTATVRKVNSGILGGIDNEDVIGAFNGSINVVFFRSQLDRVTKVGGGRCAEGNRGKSLDRGDSKKSNDGFGEHDDDVVVVDSRKMKEI